MLCENCESRSPNWKCIDCIQIICGECKGLHSKIKAFRDHNFEKYEEPQEEVRICCNCEEVEAKFQCNTCLLSDQFYCLGCSLFHTKIKGNRHHILMPTQTRRQDPIGPNSLIYNISEQLKEAKVMFFELYDNWMRNNLLQSDFGNLNTTTIVIFAISTYIICKIFLGTSALLVQVLVLGGGYWYLQKSKQAQLAMVSDKFNTLANPENTGIKTTTTATTTSAARTANPRTSNSSSKVSFATSTPSSSSLSEINIQSFPHLSLNQMEKEFPNEFSYSLKAKPASFKLRSRPYKPRSNRSSPVKPNKKSQQEQEEEEHEINGQGRPAAEENLLDVSMDSWTSS